MNWEDVRQGDFVIAWIRAEARMVRGEVKAVRLCEEEGLTVTVAGYVYPTSELKLMGYGPPMTTGEEAPRVRQPYKLKNPGRYDHTTRIFRQKLIAKLRERDEPMRQKDIAAMMGVSVSATAYHLERMVKKGDMQREGYGYVVTGWEGPERS